MRTRTKDTPFTSVWGNVKRSRSDISSTTGGSGFLDLVDFRSMTDQVSPGYFRAKRESGLLPVNPMQYIQTSWLCEPGSLRGETRARPGGGFPSTLGYKYEVDGLGGVGGVSGDWVTSRSLAVPAPVSPDKADMLQAALARAQTDAWDTATFLAELGKTVDMLSNLHTNFNSHVERVLRDAERRHSARKHQGLSLMQAFNDAWLTARYGLRPMYYDALAIQETLQRLQSGVNSPLARGWVTRESDLAVASSSRVVQGVAALLNPTGKPLKLSTDNPLSTTIGASELFAHYSHRKTRYYVARATVGVQVTTRSLTMFDPAVTAWEMTPYSFIVDWFVNIGEAIAAFSPFATGLFKFATFALNHVTETELAAEMTLVQTGQLNVVSVSPLHSRLVCKEETFVRTLENPTPTLNVRINLDAAKIMDLIVLVLSSQRHTMRRLLQRR